jgi:hypothetical protein
VPSREKRQKTWLRGFDETVSPVRFADKPYGITAIFSDLAVIQLDFSATQTVWRESGILNPQFLNRRINSAEQHLTVRH